MARRELERRLKGALHRPPLSQISPAQHEELLGFVDAALVFDDLPGKWQAAIAAAEASGRSAERQPPSSGHCCG
jgi:hypothetical protein